MIVLTKEGEFVKAKRSNDAKVGEEISYQPAKTFLVSKVYRNKSMTIPLAAALCLFLFFVFPFTNEDKVYGVVAFDINPSIGVTLDRDYRVLDVVAFNQEGKQLLEKIDKVEDLKDRDFDYVANLIVNESHERGFLTEDHDIYISTFDSFFEDEEWMFQYERWAKSMEEEYTINIVSLLIDQQLLDAAREKAVSPGKMALFYTYPLEFNEIEELRALSMNQIVSLVGANMTDTNLVHQPTPEPAQKGQETIVIEKQEQRKSEEERTIQDSDYEKNLEDSGAEKQNTVEESTEQGNLDTTHSESDEEEVKARNPSQSTEEIEEKEEKGAEEESEEKQESSNSEEKHETDEEIDEDENKNKQKCPPGLKKKDDDHPGKKNNPNC